MRQRADRGEARTARLRRLAALAWLAPAACAAPNFGAPEAGARQGEEILGLWRVFFVTAAAIGALVLGLILWSIVRYRRRSDELPRQTRYNVPVEVVYTGVPVLIVAVLFALTMQTQARIQRIDPNPDLVVEVTAFQWQWRFDYPSEGITLVGETGRPPELVLPAGATVRFVLTSTDVIHAFFVPHFLVKHDAIPGRRTEFDVDVTKTGSFASGRCAEFCGLYHDLMTFTVRAVERAQFDAWVAAQRQGTAR